MPRELRITLPQNGGQTITNWQSPRTLSLFGFSGRKEHRLPKTSSPTLNLYTLMTHLTNAAETTHHCIWKKPEGKKKEALVSPPLNNSSQNPSLGLSVETLIRLDHLRKGLGVGYTIMGVLQNSFKQPIWHSFWKCLLWGVNSLGPTTPRDLIFLYRAFTNQQWIVMWLETRLEFFSGTGDHKGMIVTISQAERGKNH